MNGVLDAHVHLWDPTIHEYPWLDGHVALRRRYLPGDLDTGGYVLSGLIVVEAGTRPDDAFAEMLWIEKLAADCPAIRAMVVQAPLERGRAVGAVLAKLAERPLVVGVRRNVQDEPPGFITEPDFVAGVGALAEPGLTFDACVREHQLHELCELVHRNPGVTFILDHLGKPAIRDQRRQPWFDDIANLARRHNVVVKLSGLTTEAGWARWRPADLTPYLTHAVDVFGPDRCMYGSDWPVASLATTYPRWLAVVLDAIADLPTETQAAVLAGNARRVYRIADPPV